MREDLEHLRDQIAAFADEHADEIARTRLLEYSERRGEFQGFRLMNTVAQLIETADQAIDIIDRIAELSTPEI